MPGSLFQGSRHLLFLNDWTDKCFIIRINYTYSKKWGTQKFVYAHIFIVSGYAASRVPLLFPINVFML